ncbi:hypothetical protein [Streptomyces koyangensis]|uniref:Sensor domain-containing protein n=1 Tax=Streptomyces koyangensis TaxID=188770 RepID=A0ABX7EIQ2_9ACTN|nr:hypothetical protein [Streptomyces koyangensis]QRF04119.1 hypothetical protein G9U55_19360 [Streptomyces koyangensis]
MRLTLPARTLTGVLLCALPVTGCTTSGSGATTDQATASSDSQTRRAEPLPSAVVDPFGEAAAPSQAHLERATLNQADLDEGRILKGPAHHPLPGDKVRTTDEPCTPLARLAAGAALGTPEATTGYNWRGNTGKGSEDDKVTVTVTTVLAGYQADEATTATAALGAATDTCADSFTYTAPDSRTKVTDITRTLAPSGADEVMSVTATLDTAGPVTFVVARKGAVIATFRTEATTGDSTKPPAVPETLVRAQLALLG